MFTPRPLEVGHGNINVFEDPARSNADYTIVRFHQVITLATTMLPAEMIGEGEIGTELLGLYKKSRAVSLPLL